MLDPAHLLTDKQMREFIANGYTTIRVNLPEEFHAEIYRKTEEVFEKEGNPGNNILPRVPQIQTVFDQPEVRGAFTSILGPDFSMHIHRHCHINKPQGQGGGWHKDSYWGYKKVRYHRNRWAMAFYYPQDVTPENGPTAVRAHTHHCEDRPEDLEENGVSLCGKAGTIAIVHFDIWHRAMPNQTTNNRYMMKFQFTRMSEPQKPAWNNQEESWVANGFGNKHQAVWNRVWNWSRGTTGNGQPENNNIKQLVQTLHHENESERLNAAYTLATLGETAVSDLTDALRGADNPTRLNAAYALAATGKPAIDALVDTLSHEDEQVRADAAFALGDMGPDAQDAVPALANALKDSSEWVRHHAAEALGTIASASETAVPALAGALKDTDGQVRYNAAYALARFGPNAEEAIPALREAIHDDNRYTAGHATVALEKIGTPEAVRTLLNHLSTARWCPVTTKESTF